jgi:hypothetical protein
VGINSRRFALAARAACANSPASTHWVGLNPEAFTIWSPTLEVSVLDAGKVRARRTGRPKTQLDHPLVHLGRLDRRHDDAWWSSHSTFARQKMSMRHSTRLWAFGAQELVNAVDTFIPDTARAAARMIR